MNVRHIVLIAIIFGLFSCDGLINKRRFASLGQEQTGITFSNTLFENDTINGIRFEYIYNGSGLAVGDVNNDGLEDIFFAGNMVSSELYLNQGDLKFSNVTEMSGTTTSQWCTGVSIVDVNNDGLKDIYICVAGLDESPGAMNNIMFMNQGIDENGIPTFEDQAAQMGIDDPGYSTMGVFFDYDKDQDLDLFILTNSMDGTMRSKVRDIKKDGTGKSTDRLYRNDGDHTFTDISLEAGIVNEGYGLGVGINDVNHDGWLDVYCANDFISNDLLYINNQDGTFSEQSAKYFKHFTHNGMGMDMADINNDTLVDVMVLDMLPEDNIRQKLMIASNSMTFNESVSAGYHPQFLRNTLQLNRGMLQNGQPLFSEISYLAGIYQTDWSWAPLIVDFDNDGWKELLITNGFRKDVTNLDYIKRIVDVSRFGTREANEELYKKELEELPEVKLRNFMFRNTGELQMEDVSEQWGLLDQTFTNGTAFADFDLDGDLDLVLNNLDQPATFYHNKLMEGASENDPFGYLMIVFDDEVLDVEKIGAKLWLYHKGQVQFMLYSPFRGYKSTVSEAIHFGIGNSQIVDSLIVKWPDDQVDRYFELSTNSVIRIKKVDDDDTKPIFIGQTDPQVRFGDISNSIKIDVQHQIQSSRDMSITHTLLHSLSNYGPSLSVGDINRDGLEDVFMGGDQRSPAHLLLQQADGAFSKQQFDLDSLHHDMGSLLFDADNDGDLDLYVVSGGYHWHPSHEAYQDRLYLNDGTGRFAKAEGALPKIEASGSCVIAADYDQDDDLDLFVGGRTIGMRYPEVPPSYLLENAGGRFIDRRDLLGDEGGKLGMVTSALWTDIDGDERVDLFVVGEWMAPKILLNKGSEFVDASGTYGMNKLGGWWNSINGADLDQDGDTDYVLGNYGLNSYYQASKEFPLEMYASDLDKNGSLDPIVTHYNKDTKYIAHSFSIMQKQVPGIRNRFRNYTEFGQASFKQSFTKDEIAAASHFVTSTMASIVLEHDGGTNFTIHRLPDQVQFAPVFGTQLMDINNDGLLDILTVGNSMHEETIFGNYDASFGDVLLNRGGFEWEYVEPVTSGFVADGDKKAFVKVSGKPGRPFLLISENGDRLQALKLDGLADNQKIAVNQNDWYITYQLDGQQIRLELYHGHGFLSASSRVIEIPNRVKKLKVVDYSSKVRTVSLEQTEQKHVL